MRLSPIIPTIITVGLAISARATVVALWTFETSKPSASSGAVYSGILPEFGSGSGSGVHTDSSSVWSNPAGNGSAESFSVNHWSLGDYFQFKTSLTGFQDVQLSWGQTRSSTAPAGFTLSWSTDGSTFNPAETYSVGTDSWSSGTFNSGSVFTKDLTSVSGLDDASIAYFRLTANADASGGTGAVRVDDFQISAVPLITPVPELSTVGAVGFAVVFLGAAWRRRCC